MIKIGNELYYGKCRTAVGKGLTVAAVTVALVAGSRCAAQETVLHTFVDKSDGYGPGGGLTFNAKGDLFGTASFGREPASLDGTVFELTPKAGGGFTFRTIHGFSAATGDGANPGSAVVFDSEGTPDGENPSGGLAFDKAGNLWGATAFGGAGNSSTCGDPDGGVGICGTVFELTPNADGTWTESTLYSFVDASTGLESFFRCDP